MQNMDFNPSPRSLRRYKRKRTARIRLLQLPIATVEDLDQNDNLRTPSEQGDDITDTSGGTVSSEDALLDVQSDLGLDLLQVEVDTTALNENNTVTPFMNGVPFGLDFLEVNPVSLRLAALASKHNITNKCLDDITSLLRDVCAFNRYEIPRNSQIVEKDLIPDSLDVSFVWKCTSCNSYKKCKLFFNPFSSVCCERRIPLNSDYIVQFNVKQILTFALPTIWKSISLDSLRHCPGILRRREENNLGINDFTMTLNIDGLPLSQGSKLSIYPLLGFIDGLPRKTTKATVLLLGFWVGRNAPAIQFETFLGDIIKELKSLQDTGFRWVHPDGRHIHSRVFISTILCDSVCRPKVQGMKQWNSEYGCGYCVHREKGHYFSSPTGAPPRMRGGNEYREICSKKLRGETVEDFGISNPSAFIDLEYLDIILDFPPCVMHAVYLGVCKQFTEHWLRQGSLHSEVSKSTLRRYLNSIKPPFRVSRTPRDITLLAFYKAHELCMWMFYYSPIILSQLLDPDLFNHWMTLLRGLSLLLKDEILVQDVQLSETYLMDFYIKTELLYGPTFCHYNVHLLTHLPLIAKHHGPLQHFSMAPFENYNMQLKLFCTSSQYLGTQITKRFLRNLILQYHDAMHPEPENVTKSQRGLLVGEYALHARLQNRNFKCMLDNCEVLFFKLAHKIAGEKYYSTSYTKATARNSCCFYVDNAAVIEIDYFVYVPCNESVLAVGTFHDVCAAFDLWYCAKSYRETPFFCSIDRLTKNVLKISWATETYFFMFINDIESHAE